MYQVVDREIENNCETVTLESKTQKKNKVLQSLLQKQKEIKTNRKLSPFKNRKRYRKHGDKSSREYFQQVF